MNEDIKKLFADVKKNKGEKVGVNSLINIEISKKEEIIMKKLCEHRINTTTLDYDIGIEYCNFCGALGHYSIDKDKVEWKLPDFLVNQNYN